jgi:hypothetical protein
MSSQSIVREITIAIAVQSRASNNIRRDGNHA